MEQKDPSIPEKLKSWSEVQNKLNEDDNVIVICYATWCPHCQNKQQMWKELAEKYSTKIKIKIKIKIYKADENATEGHIEGFPTYMVKKKGENTIEKSSGAMSFEDLLNDLGFFVNGGRKRRRFRTSRFISRRRKATHRTFRRHKSFR
jgi:thiol-disulfide isomerase/thioredoxin